MKKNEPLGGLVCPPLKKILLIMRIAFILLLVGILQTTANNAYSQKTKLSIDFSNAELVNVLDQIENQTDFFFLYNEKLIDTSRKVTISVKDQGIEEVLKSLFAGTGVRYSIVDRKIILSPAETPVSTQQQKAVSGKVSDSTGGSLPGVSIVVKGTTIGKITDVEGNYSFTNLPANAVLQFSFVGMETQEIKVGSQEIINVTLRDQTVGIEEVVAVGYGTQKKTNLTGAISQVQMDKVLGDRPVLNAISALQGTISGLNITPSSIPGASQTINIRGYASINNSSGSPLVLIDNVPGSMQDLNPEDIESISVLKDAASAAIYGARGAFGVMLITTKKAKKNEKLTISYNNSFAFQVATSMPQQASLMDVLKTNQQYRSINMWYGQSQNLDTWMGYLNAYNSGTFVPEAGSYFQDGRYVPADGKYYYLKETNPQREIITTGRQQTHNVSAVGGSEKITYRLSFGYTDQDGPLITNKDYFDRINVKSFVKADITDWLSQSIDFSFTKGHRKYLENVDFSANQPVFYPTGMMALSSDPTGIQYPTNTPANYLRYSTPSKWLTETTRFFSSTSIHPVKGLEGVLEYTYSTDNDDYKRYTNDYKMINAEMNVSSVFTTPTYTNTKGNTALNALNAYVTYQKQFGKHQLKLMAGYNQEWQNFEQVSATRVDMINPDMPSFSGSTGIITIKDTYDQYSLRSGFYRLNYGFNDKYLLELNGRYDGSSKFPKEKRFGFFPSVSLGWQLGKESFMGWASNWLNELKPRASWGQLGNQSGVGNYAAIPLMTSGIQANWIQSGQKPMTLSMPTVVSADFTWEKVETLDFGFDVAMFKNRLTGTFDWYQRDTKGMLAPGAEVPSAIGIAAPDENVADLRTKGWELTVNWRDQIGKWQYGVGFNLFDSRAVITKYDNPAGLFYNADANNNYRVGMEIGEIWGYTTDGYYTVDDFQSGLTVASATLKPGVVSIKGNSNIRPGDIKFRDLDGNGEISNGQNTVNAPGDLSIIGNSRPRYSYGINANVGWKGFNLSVFVQGIAKKDAWVGGDMMFPMLAHYMTVYEQQLDYWKTLYPVSGSIQDFTTVSDNPWLPRIYGDNANKSWNTTTQTKYLTNAAYARLKNVTLSYTIPAKVMKRIKMQSAKIFFSGENLYTFASSRLPKGFDPERLSWGYPVYATYSFGINLTL